MGNSTNDNVSYDDVRTSVQIWKDRGVPIEDLSLRMIKAEIGDRGSLTTISKHFRAIKARNEAGETVDTGELTPFDNEALRTVVAEIISRRTFLSRTESESKIRAMADRVQSLEADLSIKLEIIEDLEIQAEVFDGDAAQKDDHILQLRGQLAHLEGMVAALNATIATLVASMPVGADSIPDALAAPAHVTSAVENDQPMDGQIETPAVAKGFADQSDHSESSAG